MVKEFKSQNTSKIGRVLAELRASDNLLIYTAVVSAKRLEEVDGTLIIEVDQGENSEFLTKESNKTVLSTCVQQAGLKLNLIINQDNEKLLIEKMRQLIGNKFKIEE